MTAEYTAVIPFYLGIEALEQTLNRISVIPQISEIIVVIDNPPMSSSFDWDTIRSKKIILVSCLVNSGPGYARNFGISFAKNENIIFIDSGDYILPAYIEYIESYYSNLPIVATASRLTIKLLKLASKIYFSPGMFLLLLFNPVVNSGVVIRRNMLPYMNIYNERYFRGEDYVAWIRLSYKSIPIFLLSQTDEYLFREAFANRSRRLTNSSFTTYRDLIGNLWYSWHNQEISFPILLFSMIVIIPRFLLKVLFSIVRVKNND